MKRGHDVIVIGLGAMGTSACLHLARRGLRVLGLDQFGVGHAMGSSHGESRMIRMCYYEHADYVPLLRRAYELWAELEHDAGTRLFHRTGGLYLGRPQMEFIAGAHASAQAHGLAHEVIEAREVRTRYPQFAVPNDFVGFVEPTAGFLLPERIIRCTAELALRAGADLRGHEPAIEWESAASAVRVRTATGLHEADALVLCGGAWMNALVRERTIHLTVTRQALGWVWPQEPALFTLGSFPVWAIAHEDGSAHYGFPIVPPEAGGLRAGMKLALHAKGAPATPEAIDRVPRAEDEGTFRSILGRFMPRADGALLSMSVCMYTNTPDSHFIIDHHPAHRNVIIAGGFSGHGFKFATVVGEALADLVGNGRTNLPIGFLSLDRFAGACS